MPGLLLSADLLFSSKVTSTAKEHGWALEMISTAESLVQQAESGPMDLVLIDLTVPGLQLQSLVSQLRRIEVPPRFIVAFGPHVHQQKLSDAATSGCDKVFTRGQLSQQMADILRQYFAAR